MQGQTFVFFGIAGSGKGTQIELLQKYLTEKDSAECVYAGTGAGFRNLTKDSDSYLTRRIQDTLNAGQLMPDFFATSIITNILVQELTHDKHLVADGYPRTVRQVDEFMDMMNFFEREKVHVIYLEISKEESLKRNLLRGRSDDTEETINKRYDEYMKNVSPALEYMKNKPGYVFHKIHGEQSREEVYNDIISALGL
jgi:adenylate kinase